MARADIILIIIIILSQKNICDSEIVVSSFFFNGDRFVLYVLGKDSEFLDINFINERNFEACINVCQ